MELGETGSHKPTKKEYPDGLNRLLDKLYDTKNNTPNDNKNNNAEIIRLKQLIALLEKDDISTLREVISNPDTVYHTQRSIQKK